MNKFKGQLDDILSKHHGNKYPNWGYINSIYNKEFMPFNLISNPDKTKILEMMFSLCEKYKLYVVIDLLYNISSFTDEAMCSIGFVHIGNVLFMKNKDKPPFYDIVQKYLHLCKFTNRFMNIYYSVAKENGITDNHILLCNYEKSDIGVYTNVIKYKNLCLSLLKNSHITTIIESIKDNDEFLYKVVQHRFQRCPYLILKALCNIDKLHFMDYVDYKNIDIVVLICKINNDDYNDDISTDKMIKYVVQRNIKQKDTYRILAVLNSINKLYIINDIKFDFIHTNNDIEFIELIDDDDDEFYDE